MKVYLAGKMTGLPGFNFQAFLDAEAVLVKNGIIVWSPASHEIQEGIVPWPDILEMSGDHAELAEFKPFDMSEALRRDMNVIADSDGIVLLDGWASSSGAMLEMLAARWAKKKVYGLTRNTEEDADWELFEYEPDELTELAAWHFVSKAGDLVNARNEEEE